MGMTITEKIFARAAGKPSVKPGDLELLHMDMEMLYSKNPG